MIEYLRPLFHLFFGTIVLLLLIFFSSEIALIVSIVIFIFGLALSHSIKSGMKVPIVSDILHKVERLSEKGFPGYGAIVFFFGVILILAFAPSFLVKLGAICILVFGDAFSSIIGKKYGKIRVGRGYSIEGTIGGIVASFLVLSMLFEPFIALTASTLGMLSEFLNFEDNISIPVTGAIVLSFML